MTAMIEVEDLVKEFGTFRAVDRISFSVPEGTHPRVSRPERRGQDDDDQDPDDDAAADLGPIRVAGFDPVREQAAVRRAFGIVFQDPSLDDELTAYENMELHGVLYGVPRKTLRERMRGAAAASSACGTGETIT